MHLMRRLVVTSDSSVELLDELEPSLQAHARERSLPQSGRSCRTARQTRSNPLRGSPVRWQPIRRR